MSAAQIFHILLFAVPLLLFARKLPRIAMERPVGLGMALSAIILCGMVALTNLPVELMPNVSYGNVTIFVSVRGGMPPPDVERLVTKPIEEAMGTVTHLRNLVSSSKPNRSIVTLEFDPGTNMDLAILEVREKFLGAKSKLPSEIEKPVIAKYEESDSPIFIAALTSDLHSPEQLRHFVDSDVKEKLLRVEGVANIDVGGGRERKIIVDIDRAKLAAFNLPIKKVVAVVEQNNLNLKTGEVRGSETMNFGVRTVGAFRSIDDIRNIAIAVSKSGGRVRLKDIASVKDSYLESESYSRLNAKSAVTLYIQKESAANTVNVARSIEGEMERFRRRLPDGIELVTISNHKRAILSAIHSVEMTLLYGVALVILVLPLFLARTRFTRAVVASFLAVLILNLFLFYVARWPLDHTAWLVVPILAFVAYLAFQRVDLRMAFVVALSIPLAVSFTFAFMYFEGISINVMSLSGLILGVGLLIDNAVVVIENYDRIRNEEPERSLKESMVKAADEMVAPMIGGTLTTVVVFLAFSLLQKQAQILFAGISFAVTVSLFASLFTALTLVPALGCRLDPRRTSRSVWDERFGVWWEGFLGNISGLRRNLQGILSDLGRDERKRNLWIGLALGAAVLAFRQVGSWVEGIYLALAVAVVSIGIVMVRSYSDSLKWCFKRKSLVFGTVGGLFLFAFAIFVYVLPKDFMASSERSEFVIFVELDTGVRLDISNRVAKEVEEAVRDYAPTRDAIKNVSSKVEGWSTKVYVTLNDLSERRKSTQEVIDTIRPEVDRVVDNYARDYKAFAYFSEPQMGKEVFLEIFGYEYDFMARLALEAASRMSKIPGLSDVKIRYRPGRPQLSVVIDPLKVAPYGLDTKEIAETLHAQMRGLRATTFFDKAEEIETVVRINPDQRKSIEQMKNLLIATPHGDQIPLSQVARIEGDLSPSEIWRRNKSRMIQVSANLGSTSLTVAAESIRNVVKKISFPQEYYASLGGQYEEMVKANRNFYHALLLTLFLVFVVMACQLESYLEPVVIMGTVLLSAIGAVAVLSFFKTTVTMGVFVGLLMLSGIVVNNGIMLLNRVNVLKKDDPDRDLLKLLQQAGRERIRPIFMTTVTTGLGLVPMAMDRSESASLWSPLALTVIGGLVSATILTLFVIPCLYVLAISLQERLKTLPTKLGAILSPTFRRSIT